MLQWQQGDDRAFDVLYKRHVISLLRLALQKTGDPDIAEELVQDSFMKFYKQRTMAAEINSAKAYLYVILKNSILNHYRKESSRIRYQEYMLANFQSADYSTELGIESRELERLLNQEIEKLPAKCREVFKLSRQEQHSNKEIARQMGISENTVEQHMRKALRDLRSSLGGLMGVAAAVYLLGG